MSIKVCDAIMGSGKSESAITYMNEHPDKRYIYITPYLSETKRIVESCSSLRLFEPCLKKENGMSKTVHTIDLVRRGMSIATTHQAFRLYPKEMVELIRNWGYTLIIDENINVLERVEFDPYDIEIAIDASRIEEQIPGVYTMAKDEYAGTMYKDLFRLLRSRDLVAKRVDGKKQRCFFWLLSPELLLAFEDVFVLTYLFEGQDLYNLLALNEIPYDNIYVSKRGRSDGVFRFTDSPDDKYIPEYVKSIRDTVHVINKPKLNAVGRGRYALSMNWFAKNPDGVDRLRKDVRNVFTYHCKSKCEERLWSTYKKEENRLSRRGYTTSFIPFNTRATNEYRQCTVAAYCVNLFMNVSYKQFYKKRGVDVDEDLYALSNMVQWIWRTAIRDGKEIQLYVPSERMRLLLLKWMDDISKEVNE